MSSPASSRPRYDRQLQSLTDELLLLGSMVEKSVERSVEALRERNPTLARSVIADDRVIDDSTLALEERALLLLATQQPTAGDLRAIAATLFIITELERIGDYAEGIAKIALALADEPPLKPLIDIPRMALLAIEMLHASLGAFIERDLEECRQIWRQDDEVDALYQQVYHELVTFMRGGPETIERADKLLWVAHNLERIGDRVTNICERTAFVITGNPRELPGTIDPC